MRTIIVLFLVSVIGCGKDAGEESDSGRENDDKSGNSKQVENKQAENKQPGPTEKLYGDIKLTEWKNLTIGSIEKCVTNDDVLEILGGKGKVTSKKSSYSDAWIFETRIPDHRTGRVNIDLMSKDQPESAMQMQVGTRNNMVKEGTTGSVTFEKVDLSKYGVAAFWKFEKRTSHLEVLSKHKFLTISTENMLGKAFTDRAAKKEAAVKIATLLFDRLSEAK